MKKVFFVFLLMQIGFAYSQPSCLHGTGIGYLLDLWLAQFGACNCQKVGVFLNQMPDCIDSNYQIVFEDNFNGNTLDLSKWEIQPWGQGALVGHANIEYNSLNNVEVSSGTCKIIAKNENIITKAVSWKPENEILSDGQPNLRAYSYTSANLWTKEKFFWANMKLDVECLLVLGYGQLFGCLEVNAGTKLMCLIIIQVYQHLLLALDMTLMEMGHLKDVANHILDLILLNGIQLLVCSILIRLFGW